MIHYVKLHAKNGKARNKINEAGNPAGWTVLETRDYVSFSQREGPWLYVTPDNNNSDKARWVSTTDDHDFTVEIVR